MPLAGHIPDLGCDRYRWRKEKKVKGKMLEEVLDLQLEDKTKRFIHGCFKENYKKRTSKPTHYHALYDAFNLQLKYVELVGLVNMSIVCELKPF